MTEQDKNILDVLARLNQMKCPSQLCADKLESDVTAESEFFKIIRTQARSARQDVEAHEHLGLGPVPDGFDFLATAICGLNQLRREESTERSNAKTADIVTGITLVFYTFSGPIEIDEVGNAYVGRHNAAIFNARNKLLHDWFHRTGIWALVSDKVAVNKQYDKIPELRRQLVFRKESPLVHDIYLMKTSNLGQSGPPFLRSRTNHFILLVNKHAFHLTNVGLFAGQFERMKARLFSSTTDVQRAGSTTLDMGEIELVCRTLATQSHSLLFNNCQNFAQRVYETIARDKAVKTEMSSYSGATVIIQVLLATVVLLFAVLVYRS